MKTKTPKDTATVTARAKRRKRRVVVFLFEDDAEEIVRRADADEVPWAAWFRRFVRRALAKSQKGRIS